MLHRLGRVDALSKLAGGKFVAKDGAELCSSPEEHFLGKYIHNRGKRHEKAPKERNFALLAQQVEHFLGKEKQAALTGAPNPSEIGTKLNMLLWLRR